MKKLVPFILILTSLLCLSSCAAQNQVAAEPTTSPTPPPTIPTATPTDPPPSLTSTPTATLLPSPSATPVPATQTPQAIQIDPPENSSSSPSPLFEIDWLDRTLFEPGLINSEQAILNQLPGATVYHIDLIIDNTLTTLQGQQAIFYTNRETLALDEIYFRLFPNLAGGSSTVSNLLVDGQPVEPLYELRNSVLRVPLDSPLPPGESLVIQMDFAVTVPNGEGGNYGTFSFLEDVLALAHFYPMVAVFDDEGWNVEIAPTIGDVVYADTSFFLVRVSAPVSQTLVASGIEIERSATDTTQTVTFVAGPMRDFYLAASGSYEVVSRTVGEITINSYAPADLLNGAEVALDQAAQALESFNTRFGPYPFTEFDVVGTTTFALGVEYPGIVAILLNLYDQAGQVRGQATPQLMESVVAHEVAHQWFYSLIGNDQVDEPWIDEALAQYATILYYQDVYGEPGASGFTASLERRWAGINRADMPIGLPVRDYTVAEYSGIVYGRGPLFIAHLAETMGQAAFDQFLRDYYTAYRWRIATSDDFKQLAEQHCTCDLTPLFQTWVYRK